MALVGAMLQFTVAVVLDEPLLSLVSVILLVTLATTLLIANWYDVRRG